VAENSTILSYPLLSGLHTNKEYWPTSYTIVAFDGTLPLIQPEKNPIYYKKHTTVRCFFTPLLL
jgi:hypothetical protein